MVRVVTVAVQPMAKLILDKVVPEQVLDKQLVEAALLV
jgi:hypothetical protein